MFCADACGEYSRQIIERNETSAVGIERNELRAECDMVRESPRELQAGYAHARGEQRDGGRQEVRTTLSGGVDRSFAGTRSHFPARLGRSGSSLDSPRAATQQHPLRVSPFIAVASGPSKRATVNVPDDVETRKLSAVSTLHIARVASLIAAH